MVSSEYPSTVLKYVQTQGWTANLTELREGVYITMGSRQRDAGQQKMILMTVCDPEEEVTSDHIEYLLKTGRDKNVDSVALTYTVGITENARKSVKKYGITVINSKKVQSHSEAADFNDSTNEIPIQYLKRAVGMSLMLTLVVVVLFVPNGAPIATDNDGLSVYTELTSGTNPLVGDTDGDGISDAREMRGPSDPTVEDTDYDDLNDSKEMRYGTDPAEWDTDGDGIADGTEVKRGDELLPGADPLRKNIYVEIDYMRSYKLSDSGKNNIIKMFADAPVNNPDGSTGIDLHIKRSEQVPLEQTTSDDSYRDYKEQYADNPGMGYFYVLLANDPRIPERKDDGRERYRGAGGPGTVYIKGDLSGVEMERIFVHEFGHALGLLPSVYSGIDSEQVPYSQYTSVMNYNSPENEYQYASNNSEFNDWKHIQDHMISPPIQNTNAST